MNYLGGVPTIPWPPAEINRNDTGPSPWAIATFSEASPPINDTEVGTP
ncbi:unnamed protein product, partial [Gulo gulo]